MRTKYSNKKPLCACGCGKETKWCPTRKQQNKFVYGHHSIGKKHSVETKLKISQSQIGKKMPIEAIEKMRQSKIGIKLSDETKKKMRVVNAGKNNPFYGKKHSEKTKQKLSKFRMGKFVAENNPNWKGGISCEPYCDVWLDEEYKQSIRDRDNNTCQNPDCWHNCDDKPLHIHHIDYIKKNCVPRNLITLCNSCNTRANFNREEWTMFYQEIIERKYKLRKVA